MMLWMAALTVLLGTPPAVSHDMSNMQMLGKGEVGEANIIVTVNPEARVSAALGKARPDLVSCGTSVMLRVQIVNQGHVTAPLRIRLVDPPSSVTLKEQDAPLTGHQIDEQTLHIISARHEATDVTLAFSLTDAPGDLVDRDRVHLLLRCEPTSRDAAGRSK